MHHQQYKKVKKVFFSVLNATDFIGL